jgi:hypothetical protein
MNRTVLLGAVVCLTMCHIAMAWSLNGGHGRNDDLDRYWELASPTGPSSLAGAVEHAPLAPAFFKFVAVAAGSRDGFRRSMVVVMLAADLAIAGALAWAFGWPAAVIYLVLSVPLLRLYYMRFDLLPTAAVAIAVALYRRGYAVLTGVALAVGTAFKLWPLALSGWLAGRWHEAAGRTATVSWLTAAGGAVLGWFMLDGVEGIEQVVTFRGASGWQVESVGGAAIALNEGLDSLRIESDAWRVGTLSPKASVALLALGTTAALVLAWLAAGPQSIGLAWLSSVLAIMVFAPILSPQYLAWITPAAAIAFTEGYRPPAVLAGGAIPLTVLMMWGYRGLIAGEEWAVWLIVLRNMMLVAALIVCVTAIWRMRQTRHDRTVAPLARLG